MKEIKEIKIWVFYIWLVIVLMNWGLAMKLIDINYSLQTLIKLEQQRK